MEELTLLTDSDAVTAFVEWARETICLNNTDDEIIYGLCIDNRSTGSYCWSDGTNIKTFLHSTKQRGRRIIHQFREISKIKD